MKENSIKRETSRANILKAQNRRRVIGVVKFVSKLNGYKTDPELWLEVAQVFKDAGFLIRKEELE